jgi:long-chain acyl-CoA synthetase
VETIDALLKDSCRKYAGKPALRCKVAGIRQETTYHELDSLSDRIAAGIIRTGLKNADKAAILAPSSPHWVAAYFGILKAGVVVVPVDKELEKAEPRHILVKGSNVMQGYYKNPQATAEALTDGWYHTGDRGKVDSDGFLTICGRVRNLIVTSNGKNVYPEEIELELLKSPFITEVMVYGHKIDATTEEVHAIIYPNQEAVDDYNRKNNGVPMTEADVEGLIRAEVLSACKNLADYKRIKKFTLREDEFPKTTTRKIKRFAVEADIAA